MQLPDDWPDDKPMVLFLRSDEWRRNAHLFEKRGSRYFYQGVECIRQCMPSTKDLKPYSTKNL